MNNRLLRNVIAIAIVELVAVIAWILSDTFHIGGLYTAVWYVILTILVALVLKAHRD